MNALILIAMLAVAGAAFLAAAAATLPRFGSFAVAIAAGYDAGGATLTALVLGAGAVGLNG